MLVGDNRMLIAAATVTVAPIPSEQSKLQRNMTRSFT